MASLGQLTAGIAHEIKNPLNFVTNFAGVSQELLADLEEEDDPEERRALLADIKTNAALIEEHGQRADAIVRSMMEHARSGTGERRMTDVNAFVEEFAGLAHSGRRARISDFKTAVDYELHADVGAAEFVPQEIGRALINLLDNAFDAVKERSRGAGNSYAPTLRVSTQRVQGAVRISIADNGAGMTREIQDKIFEPFYTTKPTGEGTGLGLSMTYDIVVHGHGGELLVESERDRGTTFTLVLPAA
jgi:signal transduction histidine kinase